MDYGKGKIKKQRLISMIEIQCNIKIEVTIQSQTRKHFVFPRCGFSPNEFIKKLTYVCKHPTLFFYKFAWL